MISFKPIVFASFAALALAACNDDDDMPTPQEPPASTPQTSLRIIHAAPDAPEVNVYAGSAILAGLENVDYQVSSATLTVDAATYDVRVEAIVPGGNIDVITASLPLEADTLYNVFAVDTVADEVEALIVSNPVSAVTAGNARVQIVHAAPNADMVDIYVTAPGDDLSAAQPLVTASFKDFTGQVEVAAGDYQIRITPAGTTDVVYDSGTINLPDGADLVVAATQNVATGASPVTLLIVGDTGSSKAFDINTGSEIRVVHGIADAPPVDVIANDALTLFDGLGFLQFSDYINVAPATYSIDIAADVDNSIIPIENAEVTLELGMFYTAIANNNLENADLDLLVDMPRVVATEARVRIAHASQAAGIVDIYVTADGEIDNIEPTFASVSYNTDTLAETGYVSLAPGGYFVTVTESGSKNAAIATGELMIEAGKVYTAIAVDGKTPDDVPQLITLDDLAAPLADFMPTATYNITLSGSQEVPALTVPSAATATVEIDDTKGAFQVDLDVTTMMGVTMAHVHAGEIGINGPVAFPLTDDGDGTYSLAETLLTAGMLNALTSGAWYLNVHTSDNPSGEVRGQIISDTMAVVTFPLSGAQQNPPVVSDATGSGYALFDTTNNEVKLRAVTNGVEDATMAHIHSGFAGTNGGVVVALVQPEGNVDTWMTDGFVGLEIATATQLLAGGHYVNVHTPANPGGELRGQITADNIEVYGVTISGDQEVPTVATAASGYGAVTLNTTTGLISGTLNVSGLTPTMAHIHAGASGTNGPVVVALVSSVEGIWAVPSNTVLNGEMIATMQASGYYVNFHTAANPSGEIRGQVTQGF